MDLDQLFTITDYSNVTITIPRHDTCENDLQVTLACSQAATTDYDLTGQIIWPVSVLLSHYLASSPGRQLLRKRNVVEMGAGCGLAGLVASHVDANQVILTDGNDVVLDLLQRNSESRAANVKALKLIWGDGENLSRVLKDMMHVDVVIAADVVQWPAVIEPLLHSVKVLLRTSECETPMLLLGIVNRAQSTYDMFFELAAKLGFSCRRVPHEDFLKVLPESCQEHGGLVTEVWHVELVDRSERPFLFQTDKENMSDDPTLGSAYQNTSFLPR
jgi:predicted nicotinamide N-methyase